MVVKVSPLVHIEIVVPDVDGAYHFLHKVFGAEKTQEELAKYLESLCPNARCIHVELGGVVLQLVQPAPDIMPSWYEQLRENGPGVHNLTFRVDSMDKAVKVLEGEGAPVIQRIDLDWVQVYGPSQTRSDLPPVHIIDTMEKIGFRLELVQEP